MPKIKIGAEYVTKNKGDARGGYVMTVKEIKKDKISPKKADRWVVFSTVDMKHSKAKHGQALFKFSTNESRLWWFEEYCTELKRS